MPISGRLLPQINVIDCGFPTNTVKLDGISVAGDGYFASGSCEAVRSNETETNNEIDGTQQIIGFNAVGVAIDPCVRCPWHGPCLVKA